MINLNAKVFGAFSILSIALLLVLVKHGQEEIEQTFLDIWEKHKDSDSFKAGLIAS